MSQRTITIQVPVTLPWFDETKWEYVPFVKGSNFEKDWRLWNAHASGWTETQLEGVRSNDLCHMLKPIPAPAIPEGWEEVPYDPNTKKEYGWKYWSLLDKAWKPVFKDSSMYKHDLYIRLIEPIIPSHMEPAGEIDGVKLYRVKQ